MNSIVNIICINYYTESEIIRLIRSINFDKDNGIRMFIVDNSNTIKDTDLYSEIDNNKSITLVAPGGNLGYFGGAQYVYDKYRNKVNLAKFTIIANPDLVFMDDFFQSLDDYIIKEGVGVIAPRVVNLPSGIDANPFMLNRPSKFRIKFLRMIFSSIYIMFFYNWVHNMKKIFTKKSVNQIERPKEIYAPHGSCIIFTKKYFQCMGNFNFRGFLFGEEIFVAEICRGINLRVLYDMDLAVEHYEHSIIGSLPKKNMANYSRTSLSLLEDEFFS